jgi:hypothetical protein
LFAEANEEKLNLNEDKSSKREHNKKALAHAIMLSQ